MNIQSVTFYNQEIQVLNHDGRPYVAMDVEWQEFERRDQEIARLLKRIEELEKQHRNLNHPNATADLGLFRVSWKTGDRNQALKALRQQIKKLEGQKKEYENLQDKSDTKSGALVFSLII